MLLKKLLGSALAVLSMPRLTAAALGRRDDGPPPVAFDGQYMTTPVPGPTNNATEWWYFQVVGEPDPKTGIVPSFEAVFYLGFAFTLGPGDPRYQFDVSGVFPNGTTFFISAPVATLPTIVTKGQDVIGNWGEAGFALFSGSSSMVLDYNSPSAGVTGGVTFLRDKTSAHVPGSPNTQGLPYFSSLATGQPLNAAEETLYTESGWVIEMPRASAHVLLNIGGTEFKLNGTGYHDHNWAPVDFGQITYTWVLGLGSCGPYDLGYFEVKAVDSTRDADIVQGSLAYNGKFIQTQAHLYGSKPAVNTVDFQLIGQTVDPVTQQTVPTGVDVTYTLTNGTVYQFNLKNSVTNPALPVYHRWRLTGTGGKVGGQQYKCALIGEWLNPGLAVYKEGENVFADAM